MSRILPFSRAVGGVQLRFVVPGTGLKLDAAELLDDAFGRLLDEELGVLIDEELCTLLTVELGALLKAEDVTLDLILLEDTGAVELDAGALEVCVLEAAELIATEELLAGTELGVCDDELDATELAASELDRDELVATALERDELDAGTLDTAELAGCNELLATAALEVGAALLVTAKLDAGVELLMIRLAEDAADDSGSAVCTSTDRIADQLPKASPALIPYI